MPRVGKAKRLRRQARLARGVRRRVDYAELAERFRVFMAERGLGGTVVHDETGVTIVGGDAMRGRDADH